MENICDFQFQDQKIFFNYINGDWISRWWLKDTFYELKLLDKIKSLNLNGTYVDAGAHFGNHSIYFSKFCDSKKVVSIEGSELNYQYLLKNKQANNCTNMEIYNKIISNEDDVKYKMTTPYLKNTGVSRVLNTDDTKYIKKNNPENISIKLDTLLKDEKDIVLIKFDIELFEYQGLQGCEKIIEKFKPVIIIENHMENKDYNNILLFFKKHNYKTDNFHYAQSTKIYIHDNK